MYCVCLLVLVLLLETIQCAQTNLPTSELNALHDLYDNTDGTNWHWYTRNITSNGIPRDGIPWNFSGNYNPCHDKWQGLNCDCAGIQCHIIEIVLDAHNLTGQLPESMNSFIYLDLIDFEANFLHGSVPNLKNCSTLRNLDLQRNNLTGTFPDWILESKTLVYMDLSINQFCGTIPPGVSQMSNVERFIASFNNFTGPLPIELTQLTNVQLLDLKYNQFSGSVLEQLYSMVSLNTLQLARNFLTGTIPAIQGNTSLLAYIDLSVNLLHGTIPQSLNRLTNLNYLALFGNSLTGEIRDSLVTTLEELYVSANSFTGTLPTMNNTNLYVYDLNTNIFTGTIPNELFALEQLNYFDISNNYITGTLPDGFQIFNNVEHLAANNNSLSGSIPASLTNLTYLVDLLLYHNLLSGTLPLGMNRLHILESVMMQDNRLSGTLYNLINATAPLYFIEEHEHLDHNQTDFQVINSIDVSSNRFTGSIPPQIFALPHLLTFAAVSNCLSGSIPENICNASLVRSLALDGLSTASQCHDKIFKGSKHFSAYLLSFSLQGGIPSCLYQMPNLESLHMSGNGITGSIPSDVKLGPVLSDLTLSHNYIRGSIPLNIQQRVWTNLDLSYNKIGGVLDESFGFCGPDNSIMLEVNRLSGVVPRNLTEGVAPLNILQGNIFSCFLNKHTIPKADEDFDNYECGSNSFYLSLLVWTFFFGVAAVLISLAVIQFRKNSTWLPQWAVVQYLAHILSQCAEWMSVYGVDPLVHFGNSNETSIFALGQFCSDIRVKTLLATLFLMFVVLPVYIAITVPYQTYTYLYAWTASAMFISGENAALGILAILSLYLVLVIYVGRTIVQAKYTQAQVRTLQAVGNTETRWKSFRRKTGYFLGLSPAILVNCFAMIVVNLGYVYVTLHYNTVTVSVAQFVLASFKLVWNEFAVRKLLSLSVYFLENRAAAVAAAGTFAVIGATGAGAQLVETSNFLRVIKEDIPFRTIILLFNNIATPCIAIAIVSPVCFSNLLFVPPNVDTSYQLCLDAVGSTNTEHSRCKAGALTTFYTSYQPPFAYSYQCSSTFVQNYASMYVYMFLIIAFVMPVVYFAAKEVHEWTATSVTTHGKYAHKLCNLFLPALLKPLPTRLIDLLDKRKKSHRRGASEGEEGFQLDDLTRGSMRSNSTTSSMGRYSNRSISMTVDVTTARFMVSKSGLTLDTSTLSPRSEDNKLSPQSGFNSSPLSSAENSPVLRSRELRIPVSLSSEKRDATNVTLSGASISGKRKVTSSFRSSVNAFNQTNDDLKQGIHNVSLSVDLSRAPFAARPLPDLPDVTSHELSERDASSQSRPTSIQMSSVDLFMFTPSWTERKSVQRAHGSTTSTISSTGMGRSRSDTTSSDTTNNSHVNTSKHSSIGGRFRSFINKNSSKSRKREDVRTIFFSKGRFILRIITEVATLLTFGAVFPPLAVIICVSMFNYTLFTQLLIGRFLTRAQKHRDYGEIRRILESECLGVSTQLIESFGYLIFFAALFYSLFLFDTLGDVNGSAIQSAWIAVLMVLMPGLLYVLWLVTQTVYETYTRCVRYNSARNKSSKRPSAPEDNRTRVMSSGGSVQVAKSVEVSKTSDVIIGEGNKKVENEVENPIFVGNKA